MLVSQILGNLSEHKWQSYAVDKLDLHWYELNKRVMRKFTQNKVDVGIQLNPPLTSLAHGDVLSIYANTVVVVNVLPCDSIVIQARNTQELARVCYEIGNRHAQLFFDPAADVRVLLPFDQPLYALLLKMGCQLSRGQHQLIWPISANH